MYVYAHMYRCTDVCVYVCMYVEMYACRHVCMYVGRYACVYLCRYGYKDICVQMYMVCTCVCEHAYVWGEQKGEGGKTPGCRRAVCWRSAGCMS